MRNLTLGIICIAALAVPLTLAQTGRDVPGGRSRFDNQLSIEPERPKAKLVMVDGKEHLRLGDCRIELMKEKIIMIGAGQTGILQSVEPSRIGGRVVTQNVVATIRDTAARKRTAVAATRAEGDVEVKYAQVSRAVAEKQLRIVQKSMENYSPLELDKYTLEYTKAGLQIKKAENDKKIAQAELEEAEAELENFSMKAPISGEVTQILKKRGEAVRQGDDIMEVTDVSEVFVVGQIPTKYQNRIRKGTTVYVQLRPTEEGAGPYDDVVFAGKIRLIGNTVDFMSQEFEVWAEVQNKMDLNTGQYVLKAGMKSKMGIVLEEDRPIRIGNPPEVAPQAGSAAAPDPFEPTRRYPR